MIVELGQTGGNLTKGKELVRLFLPLYQAARENQTVSAEAFEQLFPGQAQGHLRLLVSLGQIFAPYGIEIKTEPGSFGFTLREQSFETPIFIKVAMLEGAHLIQPNPHISKEEWARERNMLGIYYGSPAVLWDIAKIYHLTSKERPRQIIKLGMRNLHSNCSEDTKSTFPLETIEFGKPSSLRLSQRTLLVQGGISVTIAKMLKAGKTIRQIYEGGFTLKQLGGSRKTLRSWGIEIPYLKDPQQPKRLLKDLQEEEDPEKLKELFGKVRHEFYYRYSRGENPVFIPIGKFVREIGFHYLNSETKQFVQSLEKANIPSGMIEQVVETGTSQEGQHKRYYYFMLCKHKEQAEQVLLKDPNLKRFLQNPVTQLCGTPQQDLPTTTAFRKPKEYTHIGVLFKRLQVFSDCPVAVFYYSDKNHSSEYICHVDDEQSLREFIQNKIQNSKHDQT